MTSQRSVMQCPECNATIPEIEGVTHAYLPAPPGCWARFNEVLAKEFSQPEYFKAHRLTVDAYCAQHASGNDRRQVQSVVVHLVALYLNFEMRYSNERIAQVMDVIIRQHKHQFPKLSKPSFMDTLNIAHVVAATSAAEHYALAENWARDVWQAWNSEHDRIAKLAATAL
jgi:hypothetical protein